MTTNLNCTNCGANLTPRDMEQPHCPYCRSILPHHARAAQQVEVVRQMLGYQPGMMPGQPPPGGGFFGGSPPGPGYYGVPPGYDVGENITRAAKRGMLIWLAVSAVVAVLVIVVAAVIILFVTATI